MTRLASSFAALLVGVSAVSAPAPAAEPVGDFTLRDSSGVERSLSRLAEGKRAVVLAFVGTECPLARLYAPRLADLARTYEGQGVAVVGIDPNHQDDLTEIAAYVREHELPFPVLADGDATVADALG
ncbi:MAG TPA: redoxin domain-containing protein, partial [Planctomycetaceae bacterium]